MTSGRFQRCFFLIDSSQEVVFLPMGFSLLNNATALTTFYLTELASVSQAVILIDPISLGALFIIVTL